MLLLGFQGGKTLAWELLLLLEGMSLFYSWNGKVVVVVEKKYVWKAIKGMNIYFMFRRMDGGGVISA